jgi:hypothetical protein
MVSNSGMKVKRNDYSISRVVDGEVVVLLPEGAMIHALMGCGSRIWELIDGGITVSEIVQRICDEYEVEPQRAREEITEFIHELVTIKLVEIMPAAGEEVNR